MVKKAGRKSSKRAIAATPVAGPLELVESEDLEKRIGRALRAKREDLGEDPGEAAGAPYLAASFVAYAAEKMPQLKSQWCKVLLEVLADAGSFLDEDDNEQAVSSFIDDLVARKILAPVVAQIEEGSVVLAVLAEDNDWHHAVVQKDRGDGVFGVLFLEYGKPQDTPVDSIRLMEMVVDDEEAEEALQLGKCEMCDREKLLTFHHLIPKDAHSTYLKKRLPPGIEGEPTRHFLNTYGTMICRQCHSFVHRIAPNSELAKEYNTLQKIMDEPSVQAWVKWVGGQDHGRC